MITVEYIAKQLASQFPEHNFIPSDRISYKVIQVDGSSELRLTNDVLENYAVTDTVWFASLSKTVSALFVAEKTEANNQIVQEQPTAQTTYAEQMSKDFETEEV